MHPACTDPDQKRVTSFPTPRRKALAVLVAAVCAVGGSFGCPGEDNPCIDGILGATLTDFTDEEAVWIRLTNRSEEYVHLIGWREQPDLCNRVDDNGGYRYIYVPSDFISVRVRAYQNGQLIDEIVCELGGGDEVVYTDSQGLVCVE